MTSLKVEYYSETPHGHGRMAVLLGDCTHLRIGQTLKYSDGRSIIVESVGTQCSGTNNNIATVLLKGDVDTTKDTLFF